jgi:hypothetical protein
MLGRSHAYRQVNSLTFPAPALGWHGAFGGGGPFHDVAGPGFDWAEVQDMNSRFSMGL